MNFGESSPEHRRPTSEEPLRKDGDRLSPMDAMLLYFETPSLRCNIIGVGRTAGPVSFDEFVADLEARLDRLPSFRQIIVPVPLNLAHPTWEGDPHFDLVNHVHEQVLDPPGSERKLRELASRINQERFDFRRPPWAVHIVSGVEGNGSAIIVQFHHCISDGIGMQNVLSALLPLSPGRRHRRPHKTPVWAAPPVPSPALRLARGLGHGLHRKLRWIRAAARRIAGTTSRRSLRTTQDHAAGSGLKANGRKAARVAAILNEFARAPTLRLPFNTPLSGATSLAWTSFDLEEMRTIKSTAGGTLNDVLLSILAGAIERFSVTHGIETEGRYLRVRQAADVRASEGRPELGNRVAFIPALLPLGDRDPVQRLHLISEYTSAAKAAGVRNVTDGFIRAVQELLPPPILKLALRLRFANVFGAVAAALGRPPSVNVYVTNIHWPEFTLHAGEQPICTIEPFAPLLPGVGLTCTALSYRGQLHLGLTADSETTGDVEALVGYFERAYEELRSAAGVGGAQTAAAEEPS